MNRYRHTSLVPQSWWSTRQEMPRDIANFFDQVHDLLRDSRNTGIPRIFIEEQDQQILVRAMLPGYDPESLEAEVLGDFLTIRGDKPSAALEDQERFLHRERSGDHLEETIKLPSRVNPAAVNAVYRDGILTITMPRENKQIPQSIKVEVSE